MSIQPTSTNRIYPVFTTTDLVAETQVWTLYGLELPGPATGLAFSVTNDVPSFFRAGVRKP